MIDFPQVGEKYVDTQEGGMSVFAVWKAISDENVKCCVELYTAITGHVLDDWYIKRTQDVLRRIKSRMEHIRSGGKRWSSIPNDIVKFERDGRFSLAHSYREISGDEAAQLFLSEELLHGFPAIPVAGVVYLGSTSESLWDERAGEYWTAKRSDLTEEGGRVIETLDRVYGTKAILATVLDT